MGETYKNSGVDIDAGDQFVDLIAPAAKMTYRKEVLGGVGPFAASFALDLKKYKNPVLVSSTDGVGTKLKLAIELKKYDTIGQDLVAMCVNDLVCCGAEPLFFLDYFAMGALRPVEHSKIIEGIARACKACNCSLIGGETAEMPGMYQGDDFDLAGFSVGAVERDKSIDGRKISEGDIVIGVASSGIHSNGYSLVRKIVSSAGLDLKKYGGALLEPTKLYPPLVLSLLAGKAGRAIHGIAHITGGGIVGNVPRIFHETLRAEIMHGSWEVPEIFNVLQKAGQVEEAEMMRVFNLGVGLVLVVCENSCDAVLRSISDLGEKAWKIGVVVKRKKGGEDIVIS